MIRPMRGSIHRKGRLVLLPRGPPKPLLTAAQQLGRVIAADEKRKAACAVQEAELQGVIEAQAVELDETQQEVASAEYKALTLADAVLELQAELSASHARTASLQHEVDMGRHARTQLRVALQQEKNLTAALEDKTAELAAANMALNAQLTPALAQVAALASDNAELQLRLQAAEAALASTPGRKLQRAIHKVASLGRGARDAHPVADAEPAAPASPSAFKAALSKAEAWAASLGSRRRCTGTRDAACDGSCDDDGDDTGRLGGESFKRAAGRLLRRWGSSLSRSFERRGSTMPTATS